MGEDKNLSTENLMRLIQKSDDIKTSLTKNNESINNPTVEEYLHQMLEAHHCKISEVIVKSVLSRSFVYQIFDGTRKAGRDVLIRISFAIGLSLEETQRLLNIAHKGALYPKVRRDAVIIYCLHNHYDLNQVCELLESVDEPILL